MRRPKTRQRRTVRQRIFQSPCMAAPERANAAPESATQITRGSRTDKMTDSANVLL